MFAESAWNPILFLDIHETPVLEGFRWFELTKLTRPRRSPEPGKKGLSVRESFE